MRIADLFHPTSADDFLLDYFGQQALHTAGSAERFARFANPASADELAWSLERELEAPFVAETARNAPEPQRGAHGNSVWPGLTLVSRPASQALE